jgi:hypothetical protein
MHTFILIASIALGIAILLFLSKLIEMWIGLPKWYIGLRDKVDYGIETSLHMTHSTFRSFASEVKEALSKTPHLIVHLGIIIRDKLKVYFAKYIDEVRGRKPLTEKKSNSEFLHAVKDYKKEESSDIVEQVEEK